MFCGAPRSPACDPSCMQLLTCTTRSVGPSPTRISRALTSVRLFITLCIFQSGRTALATSLRICLTKSVCACSRLPAAPLLLSPDLDPDFSDRSPLLNPAISPIDLIQPSAALPLLAELSAAPPPADPAHNECV